MTIVLPSLTPAGGGSGTRLDIYNGALRIIKERRLSSLTENREPRRLLDDAWGDGQNGGAVKYCLQMGQWTFAKRTMRIDYSPSITPDFGYRCAFDQPEDMVKPVGIWCDEYCQQPLLRYSDERHYWFTDIETIYVGIVSNGLNYGADLSLWPETFAKLVEAYLAREIAPNLTNSDKAVQLAEYAWKKAKVDAKSDDAMRNPTKFMPAGGWLTSRHGSTSNRGLWNGRS